jgi:hypothetical protein
MNVKTVSIELPIYDIEEFYMYIEDKLDNYTSLHIDQVSNCDDWDDCSAADIEYVEALMKHYDNILSYLRSTYTDKKGNIRSEFNYYI